MSSLSIWDWEAGVKLNQFHNHTSKTCKISSMEFLNSHDKDKSLLAVATGIYNVPTVGRV